MAYSMLSRVLMAGICLSVVSGCDSARRSLGMSRTAPDEFAVVSRAPLTVPPDFDLMPPRPGAARPQEESPKDAAQKAVLGGTTAQVAPTTRPMGKTVAGVTAAPREAVSRQSVAEADLLAKAKAADAQPDIRQVLDRETLSMASKDNAFADAILFWRKPALPGTVVDAEKESERLKANKAAGKNVTDGDIPIVKRRAQSALEGLF